MKELEHVFKRVRVDGAPLKECIFAIARAIAERTIDADRGVQMAIQTIGDGARKQRSTVKTALKELCRLGLLHRSKSEAKAKYSTDIYRFNQILIDASKKSRPYSGSDLVFPLAKLAAAQLAEESANICKSKTFKARMKPSKTQIPDGQLLTVSASNPDGQNLTRVCKVLHIPHLVPAQASLQASCIPPAPQGGGGVCSDPPQVQIAIEIKNYYEFLEKNELGAFKTFCQRRKKDGRRGGVFGQHYVDSLEKLNESINWAVGQKLELVMHARGLLLVDDLSVVGVELVKKSGLRALVIETSQNNYQALFTGGSDWTSEHVREAQKGLRTQFGGDVGATAATQLHRLPGSLNQKNGGCFVTRLVWMQDGEFVGLPSPAQQNEVQLGIKTDGQNAAGPDKSESGKDFTYCFALIRRGESDAEVTRQILARAIARGREGNNKYYASYTAAKARTVFKPSNK